MPAQRTLPGRPVVWLNWVVANAAGGGGLAGIVELIQQGTAERLVPYGGAGLLTFVAGLLLVMLLFYVQELILEASGLPATYWGLVSLAGLFLGTAAGTFVAVVIGAIAIFILSEWLLFAAIVGSVFGGGAVCGGIQSAIYWRSWRAQLVWTNVSGLILFPMLFLHEFLQGIYGPVPFSATRHGTLLGGLYGLATGTCLVWLIPRSPSRATGDSRTF